MLVDRRGPFPLQRGRDQRRGLLVRPAEERSLPFRIGLGGVVFLATALTFAWGFGEYWLNAWPTLKRAVMACLLLPFPLLAIGAAAKVASWLPLMKRWPVLTAHAVMMLSTLLLAAASFAVGQAFVAMCLGWCLLLLIGGAVISALVELGSRSATAAVISSAAFLSYFMSEWIPIVW